MYTPESDYKPTADVREGTRKMANGAAKVVSGANQAAGGASQMADDLQGDLSAKAHELGRKVRGFVDHAGDEIAHTTEAVTTQIKEKPFHSTAIALAVGFFLGTFLRRS